MGYFNIFYKITRIIDMLTRKRNRKVIAVILIAITLIWFLHTKGYCAQEDTTYTTDTSYFMIEQYNNIVNYFVLSFDKYYGKNDTLTGYFNTFFDSVQNGNFPYFYLPNALDGGSYVRAFIYNRSTAKTYVDTSLVYNDGTRIPSTAYNYTWLARQHFLFYSTYNILVLSVN